ncbi:MAG: ATP-binding protein [Christensenellales bacterium]
MRKILSQLRSAIEKYNLIEDGDKIAVGLSGGKDSLVLLSALSNYRIFSPVKFDLIAITVDQTNGETDFSCLSNFCEKLNVEFYVEKTEIFNIVFNERKEKNPCSLCAKLRRGILNSTAKKLGCNKVALAHHKDDLLETFFLSLFYEGRLSTFSPKTYLSNVDITAIRPLVFTDEKTIISASKDLPIVKNICPANHKTKREDMKNFLADLEKKMPNVKNQIFNAITSPERYNLFDKFLKNN